MPECLLLAYYDHLDRLRAERTLDDATTASFPHLTKQSRTSWLRDLGRRAARRLVAPTPAEVALGANGTNGHGPAPFTVNGTPVGADGLKRWLVQVFGG